MEEQKKIRYNHIELGVIIATVGLTATVYGILLWQSVSEASRISLLLAVFLSCMTLTRLFACLYLYRSPFNSSQWTLLMLFIAATLFSYTPFAPLAKESSLLRIERSTFEVTIQNDGDATLRRIQTMVPLRNLNKIPEVDFYSSGGLTKDNFKMEIHELEGGKKGALIPCKISEFEGNRLINEITNGHKLHKNKRYTRTTTLEAPGSFTDQVADEFRIIISYPVDYFECTIWFEEPCSVKVNNLALLQIKRRGRVLSPPDTLPVHIKDSHHLNFYRRFPYLGDEFAVTWKYWVPPTTPSEIPPAISD